MSPLNTKARLAMRFAWALARKGQAIYGGTVRQHFPEALRLSWQDVNDHPLTKAVDELLAVIRANRGKPIAAPTPYLARYRGAVNRRIWADSRL